MSAALVLFAAALRLVLWTGADQWAGQALQTAFSSPETAGFLFYLELGQIGRWDMPAVQTAEAEEPAGAPADPDAPAAGQAQETDTPETTEAAEPADTQEPSDTSEPADTQEAADPSAPSDTQEPSETADVPLVFTAAEAAAIAIGGGCTYQVDQESLLLQPCYLNFDQEGPTVLIVHTHTSEAYTQEAGWEYDENETARTQDPDFSVVRVGRELAETLEAHGISVIHDTSFNDYPSYNGAYDRTLTKIQQWVELYPSIQMVIDVHRDAAANADGTPVSYTADIGGESTARLMLVVGTDQGGLWHPNWQDNLSWALKLQAVLNRMYPGLCRDINLRTERFNQHVTAGSLLVEVGASGNTLRQALAAARDLGEGLAALIEGT